MRQKLALRNKMKEEEHFEIHAGLRVEIVINT